MGEKTGFSGLGMFAMRMGVQPRRAPGGRIHRGDEDALRSAARPGVQIACLRQAPRSHTTDLTQRVGQHNNGVTPSTRNRGPSELVYSESYATRSEATARERVLKTGNEIDRRPPKNLLGEGAGWKRPESVCYSFCAAKLSCAPVAQLDRASGYEPEGREFESPRARHSSS